jgi:hypothetical protein
LYNLVIWNSTQIGICQAENTRSDIVGKWDTIIITKCAIGQMHQ